MDPSPANSPLLRLSIAALLVLFSSCNCGRKGAVGEPCKQSSECESGVCGGNQTCAPSVGVDGGGNVPVDGGSLVDGGQLLPDGGTCVNLSCQVASCPGGGTTTVTGTVYDPGG